MPPSFDVRLDDLSGAREELREVVENPCTALTQTSEALASALYAPIGASLRGATFFIETFGCQMNAHDSEKVAGVLLGRGYRQAKDVDGAKLVFYNTCSIREKAAQKVFSRLGQFRKHPDHGKVIGVLGCVAQQEGEEIF